MTGKITQVGKGDFVVNVAVSNQGAVLLQQPGAHTGNWPDTFLVERATVRPLIKALEAAAVEMGIGGGNGGRR